MMALLPPSSSRDLARRPPTTSPTRRPILHEPVALISGILRSARSGSPTSSRDPKTNPNTSHGSPLSGVNISWFRMTS